MWDKYWSELANDGNKEIDWSCSLSEDISPLILDERLSDIVFVVED